MKTRATISGIAAAAMLAATSLTFVPAANAASPGAYNGGSVVLVGDRGDNWWWKHRHHRRHHRHHHHDNDFDGIGLGIFGFATGAILGSALAQPHYYSGGSRDDYCSAKYRTYKPWTGTYTGYDGREHRCRIP